MPNPPRLGQEVLRWTAIVALLYGVVLLFNCPCRVLLECKDHSAKFNGAVALAVIASVADALMNPKPKT